MTHEIYVFGSICRGDVSPTSDVDILLIPFGSETSNFPSSWSIYGSKVIHEYFSKGRLFAWHLHLESKCIYSLNKTPYLESLGQPAPYNSMVQDLNDLEVLLLQALQELRAGTDSTIFELGIAYTAIRDIAMSASWAWLGSPSFSAEAPYLLPVPCPLSFSTYSAAKLARHSSTRGCEVQTNLDEVIHELVNSPLADWINTLRGKTL